VLVNFVKLGSSVDSQDCMSGTSCSTSVSKEHHVNLFKELEEQERKNFASGNKEYAAEKKKEQDDWESKVGMLIKCEIKKDNHFRDHEAFCRGYKRIFKGQ